MKILNHNRNCFNFIGLVSELSERLKKIKYFEINWRVNLINKSLKKIVRKSLKKRHRINLKKSF